MQIEYLTKMKNTPKIGRWENKGISEQEIEKLEQKLNVKFPKAYKEFLFLGGEFQNAIDWDTITEYLDWTQENIKESMENINLHMKPFFVFANYGNDQCLFFFFNEGENPPIYVYAEDKFYKNEKGEYVFYKKTDNSFSECIDGFIEHSLNK